MIDVDAALAIVRAAVTPLPVEVVGLAQSLGRVLASAQRSRIDLPAFDNSAMDGFAVRAPEGLAAGTELPVTGEQAAGDGARTAGDGAWEIMTGAHLPDGFDTVVPVEDVQVLARDAAGKPLGIRLAVGASAGQHVRLRCADK
jgi:molybdopterin molybdotransferase